MSEAAERVDARRTLRMAEAVYSASMAFRTERGRGAYREFMNKLEKKANG